eukprot:CAMPEP_0194214352 /NCGR_PEP_ID=MMETSP0156-20130528/15501_1 /TAXON_ID=33649 /ORGANISM="Thalassionema nitzschioides, Strain L26-B" /LENGTH=1063 /DNA_ID=CAMNT_0038942583 /DNA_START=94 /DNA_END=3285 /DNA_ORIENTATION=+
MEDDGSDVELEGMDMNDDDVKEDVVIEDPSNSITMSPSKGSAEKQLLREKQDVEAARKERMALAVSAKEDVDAANHAAEKDDRLSYLLSQSDVFAHFLAGSVAAQASSKKKKKGGRGGSRGRMTEAEEDAQLLSVAQSKRKTVRLAQQPSILADHCKMHPYQLEGLNWLIKLHDHGIHGILADEMGLGKTLQTISLLAYLRESRGVTGPHLCIVPKSVVGNWIREFRQWCPSICAIRMGGTKEERQKIIGTYFGSGEKSHFDVLVTSYEGLLKEKAKFSNVSWEYLIIDEAHRIKNENSSLSKCVRNIKANFRVLITGTPLQNNLHELWALLNFLMPDIFGDADQFDEWFSLKDDQGQENVIRKLHTVLRPFMLRRVKKDVACGLPPKKETKLYIGLTAMQQEWYMRILKKDAHELNSLGGPDRVRLLNILMQLRKCCNHPYLFDGAEAGPPYTDGPHLWENSGKMCLLNKLLPKLKQNGSRVLVFSQMTRVLDILEDYCRLTGYQYCRLDGNTPGEVRDKHTEEFNRPGSEKFIFLLSTRAGGLGINLATADIVILYDSDWNPQVDLQAQDRAHRIGQTKPVQVFRFVSEGTVEEKIIERADRKLFLDAAVIQQGRLAEQNSSLEKDELMRMVRFGADQILSKQGGGTYTDEDIDALIARGEERTNAVQAELQTDAQHNLANFSLLGPDDGMDTFSFGGKNYREDEKGVSGNFINLPQRQRKRNYDVNEYFRDAMNNNSGTGTGKQEGDNKSAKKKAKRQGGPAVHDFQLFDKKRLDEIAELERALATKKDETRKTLTELRRKNTDEAMQLAQEMEQELTSLSLSLEDATERNKLLEEGFPDWSRKDYKAFTTALEDHGRYNLPAIIRSLKEECGKDALEVKRYYLQFWLHYTRISDHEKVMERIQRGEQKIHRLRKIRDAIHEKVERHLETVYGDFYSKVKTEPNDLPPLDQLLQYSWPLLKINYGSAGKGRRAYQEEEDAFLVAMMHRHGYGAAERIRMEIRRAHQFRFDWYFKSRNTNEIQKRCDFLVRAVERENTILNSNNNTGDATMKTGENTTIVN